MPVYYAATFAPPAMKMMSAYAAADEPLMKC